MKKLLFCNVILFLCLACRQMTPLEQALQIAGENRRELEKVLEKYKQQDLKYKAASFLIENMIYYQYIEGEWLDTYLCYYEWYAERELQPDQIVKKVEREKGKLTHKEKIVKRDIWEVDSAYLVNNIEWAFKVWEEQPWGKNISFEDFCEWILPYRIEDEKLAGWREELYHSYNPLLDSIRSLPEADDPIVAARFMLDILSKKGTVWTAQFPAGPHIGPVVTEWYAGTCREFSDIVIYVLRALGIPCGLEYFSVYSNNNDGHFWNFFPGKNGAVYVCDFPDAILRPSAHLNCRKSKTYRKQFSMNREIANPMGNDKSQIPAEFRYPLYKDVTTLYMDTMAWNISIPVSRLTQKVKNGELVYLCAPNYSGWQPVTWGKAEKDVVHFEAVEGKCVFCIAVWKNGEYQLISDAFYLTQKGEVCFYELKEEQEEVILYSKYNVNFEFLTDRMLGGVFEASLTPDFRQPDTLYRIEEKPYRLYTVVYPEVDKSYRYIRYYGPDQGFCNIAEISFYESAEGISPLQGKIIGTPGTFYGTHYHDYTRAFDGDPYSSFDYKYAYGGWTGMDLGKPTKVRKIIYTPRNRDNFVRPGDRYELFNFHSGQWKTLGQQIAASDSLIYQVPVGSLLLLRNYTRGKDERIFEYIEGIQVFR